MRKRNVPEQTDAPTALVPQLLTIEQAAAALKVGRSTVYELINENGLPYVVVRGMKRIAPTSLQQWIQQQECSNSEHFNAYLRARAAETMNPAGTAEKRKQRQKKNAG